MTERPILFSAAMVRAILEGRKTQTRRVVKFPLLAPAVLADNWMADWIGGKGVTDARGTPAPERPALWHERTATCVSSPYVAGTRLWVRETWADVHPCAIAEGRYSQPGRAGIPGPPGVSYRTVYRADGEVAPYWGMEEHPYRTTEHTDYNEIDRRIRPLGTERGWNPSIHMPRTASRLLLEIVDVRVQRLHEITREDAAAEGVCLDLDEPLPQWFRRDRWPEENFAALWDSLNAERGYGWHSNPWVWVISFRQVEA
jgi:hypothetical protein